jgi:hypothetical protein
MDFSIASVGIKDRFFAIVSRPLFSPCSSSITKRTGCQSYGGRQGVAFLTVSWGVAYDENIMATVAETTTSEQLFQDPGLGRCKLLEGFQIEVRKIFPE